LLAGAAWVSEYGSPENEADRVWLRRYSPYHQVRADQQLPEAFVTTSTRDDRVHPGHARRFTQRLRELGHRVLYFENIEGGHAGAATPASKSELLALEYVYLLRALKVVSK
jgi:prolyl oligopeptidase